MVLIFHICQVQFRPFLKLSDDLRSGRSLTWGLAGTALDNDARKKFTLFLRTATSIETPGSADDDLPLHDWAIDLDTGLWMRWGSVKEDEAGHMGKPNCSMNS